MRSHNLLDNNCYKIFMKRIFTIGIICFLLFINISFVLAEGEDAKSIFNNSLEKTAEGTGHLGSKISKLGALGSVGLLIQILLSIIGVLFLAKIFSMALSAHFLKSTTVKIFLGETILMQ